MSESLKQLADKLLTLAGQMTAAEMAAVKGCIYGMIVAVDKRNEGESAGARDCHVGLRPPRNDKYERRATT